MPTTYKFSITINDKRSSISPNHGVDIRDLAPLIQELRKAIDSEDGSYCTLYQISNHGYTPKFITNSKKQYQNFISVHQNIYEKPYEDLRNREVKYARALKSVLHGGRFLESFGATRRKPIAKIYSSEINRVVDTYSVVTNVVGVISEMGARDFKKKPHIFLNGFDYKIYTNSSQDEQLKGFYRTRPITFKIKQKRSIKSDRIISASLLMFYPKTEGNFMENVMTLSNDDLSFLSGVKNHEDVLNLITL